MKRCVFLHCYPRFIFDMNFRYLFITCLLSALFPFSPVKAQVQGIGTSDIFTISDKGDPVNQALFRARLNAAQNAGGNIKNVSTQQEIDKTDKHSSSKDQLSYSSKRSELTISMINSMVKTIGNPVYDTIRISKKNFRIKATALFEVVSEESDALLPQLDLLGVSIKIKVSEKDCRGYLYDYMKTYFRQKQSALFLSLNNFPLGETDFSIEINSDKIILSDFKASPSVILKIIKVKNCSEVNTGNFEQNEVLDQIRREIFYHYLIR